MSRRFGGGMGQGPGGPGGAQQWSPELRQLAEMANWASAEARRVSQDLSRQSMELQHVQQQHQLLMQNMTDLSNVLQATSRSGGGGGGGNGNPEIQRIENVPGRRIPYDELVAIKIDANSTSIRTGTITISQEGPFIAVARFASFLSQFSFEVTDPESGAVANFKGRTHGRWRPVHSASDIMDAFLPGDTSRVVAFPGTGAPSYSSPALHAPARSMEFDARIEVLNQGSAFPRSNIPVPSSFYSQFINSPFQLGALDFFARADVIEFRVQPQHVNNPNAGNLFGFGAGGVFPFSDAQFDHHEGVADPENLAVVEGDPDPVTRLPEGILLIGFHGYRIVQPPGAVVNLSAV